MKIQIQNFGPIHRFDFDLSKDLIVVFGKNNIGKSYAISAIYLILKSFSSEQFRDSPIEVGLYFYRRSKGREQLENVKKHITDILDLEDYVTKHIEKNEEIDVTENLRKIFTNLIASQILPNLEKSFNNSFDSLDSLRNKISNKRFSISIKFNSFEFTVSVIKNRLVITNLKFYSKIVIRKNQEQKKAEHLEKKHILYFNLSAKSKNELIDSLFLEYYTSFKEEITEYLNNIYFLPASRSGLYQALSTFNAVIAELSKSRNFLSNKIELPNISEPVLDYFLALANVSDKKVSKKFGEIVKKIENQILEGKVSFNNDTKKLVFTPQKMELELDLAFTSSMISEIAPIVAFFKYVITDELLHRKYALYRERQKKPKIKPSNMIFIEEPEAHLHPEIQVKLMEVFAELINYDVKIVMTSHSNYMFNKLSNLVLDKKVDFNKIGSYLMFMDDYGSKNDTMSMAATEEGMVDQNFVDVAEKLYEERIKIYEKLNANVN